MKFALSKVFFLVAALFLNCGSNGKLVSDQSNFNSNQLKPVYSSYEGLVMCGYQGWFNAKNDGANRQWHHYDKKGQFKPGSCTIDFWPDVSEYEVTYETSFQLADGTHAHVYSPYDKESVDLHFKWMKKYGIDGVFMQRFVSEIKRPSGKHHFNTVLRHALKAAKKYGRAISIMYDLSGSSSSDMDIVYNDWVELQEKFNLFDPEINPTYLWHNNKPLVAIWGVGFNDGREYSTADAQNLLHSIKRDDNPSSVLLGVPYYWRKMKKDAEKSPLLHQVISQADIILPWAVGRYNHQSYKIAKDVIANDIAKCQSLNVDYLPVVFPGFSWANLHDGDAPLNQIPRQKGKFLWRQCYTGISAGAKSIYVAMFDELDEGTCIFKCTDHLPVGESSFANYEGLPSDYYLWLAGAARRMLRGEMPLSINLPQYPTKTGE